MIIFETPQSSRSKIKVTLERSEAELPDVEVDEIRLLNPSNMLIAIHAQSPSSMHSSGLDLIGYY